MTNYELIEILKGYPEGTKVSIEFAPGSGNYSEDVEFGDGRLDSRGEPLCEEEWDEEEEGEPYTPNVIFLYPYTKRNWDN